jgi:hypothetical protein
MHGERKKSNPKLRTIKTARTLAKINAGAQRGFFPLMRPVKPNPEIRVKYAVFQNPETGEIVVSGDYRYFGQDRSKGPLTRVLGWTYYYPYSFPSPFAAYLLPPDLEVGEHVWLEDLIEDIVGETWNQGNKYRLKSAEAIWNGKDFEIQFDDKQIVQAVG